MKMPWERSDKETAKDKIETDVVRFALRQVMDDLRRVLDEAEARIEKELPHGS